MHVSERGGTLLVLGDNAVLFSPLQEGEWVVATWRPDNYPAFNVATVTVSEETLRVCLQAEYAGWLARKNNIELDVDASGYVKEVA